MKLNRIDSNKICYILNQDDLDHYNLTIKDLAYGSEKSKALMNHIIDQLSREINFNPEQSNLAVELIPLETGELKVQVSAIDHENDDDLNILFSNLIKGYTDTENGRLDFDEENSVDVFLPFSGHNEDVSLEPLSFDDSDDLRDEMHNLSPIIKANAAIDGEDSVSLTHAYEFESLDEIILIARIIKQVSPLRSSLYKDRVHGKYLLLLESNKRGKVIKGICNLISENGGKPNHRYTIKSYCEEHLELMIRDVALKQLSRI